MNDHASFRTLYCGKLLTRYLTLSLLGPDPAAPERVLIRKLVELNEGSWAYEETRVTKVEGKSPQVHSQMTQLANFDIKEHVSLEEHNIRERFWVRPNLLSFSSYFRQMENGGKHFSVVENTLWKAAGSTWG